MNNSTQEVKAAKKEVEDNDQDEVFSNVSSMKDFSQSDESDQSDNQESLMECQCNLCSKTE